MASGLDSLCCRSLAETGHRCSAQPFQMLPSTCTVLRSCVTKRAELLRNGMVKVTTNMVTRWHCPARKSCMITARSLIIHCDVLQARAVCRADPLVANELGVLAFRNRQLDAAIHHFTTALEVLPPKASAGEAGRCDATLAKSCST